LDLLADHGKTGISPAAPSAAVPGAAASCAVHRQRRAPITAYFAGFDVDDTPEFLIAEGAMVVVHDTYRFKHKGEFQGIPPTGKEASITGAGRRRGGAEAKSRRSSTHPHAGIAAAT
jgi:hypothetical protein